jgi:hypothetical protein
MRHVPAAVALYEQLGVKKALLCLIPPAFETPLPPLQTATFPPCPREPPPPALELFDLDDAFAGEQVGDRLPTCANAECDTVEVQTAYLPNGVQRVCMSATTRMQESW